MEHHYNEIMSWINGTISVGIIIGIIVLSIKGYFQEIFLDNLISYGDGRINLWSKAFDTFKANPIFGGGFYYLGGDPKVQLDNIMPHAIWGCSLICPS